MQATLHTSHPLELHADLASLWLLHWPKGTGGAALLPAPLAKRLATEALVVDTCLRQLAFGVLPKPSLPATALAAADVLTGEAAWRFALEVATGLCSAVPGETNVFGQLKKAWSHSPLSVPHRRRLAPLVDALFADARQIRQAHLQGIGGNSYGSLARRLLAPRSGARILLVGTGDLARSLLPFLSAFDVGAWNHRPVATGTLDPDLHWFAPDAADEAAAWADHLIFTTPADDGHERDWVTRLLASDGADRADVLHLGRRRPDGGSPWAAGIRVQYLDDLFELAAAQQNLRAHQLAKARRACADLASDRWPAPALLAHG